MSSFIVEDRTIHRIATWIKQRCTNPTFSSISNVERLLNKYGIEFRDSREFYDKFCNSLLLLNKMAVDQRYDEENLIQTMKFKVEQCSQHQVLASIRCLKYQCSEGDVPQRKLYKFLDELSYEVAFCIATECREYDECEWG